MQSQVIQAVVRLHNFIIDNDRLHFGTITLNADGTIDPTDLELFGIELLPVGDEDGQGPAGNIGFLATMAWSVSTKTGHPPGGRQMSMSYKHMTYSDHLVYCDLI
jgi:hypothetical protein